jgi:hypothetical protein
MKTLIVCVALLLSGCTTVLPVAKTPLPTEFMQPCAPLVMLQGTTGADLLANITQNSAIFWACKDSKDALIKAISK